MSQLLIHHTANSDNKCLRFSPRVQVEFRPELTFLERQAQWWSPEERECLISKALYSAEECKDDKVTIDALNLSLHQARQVAVSLNKSAPERFVTLPLDQGFLNQWCNYGDSRRGLEKWVSRAHETTREKIARKARSKVVALSMSGATPEEICVASRKASVASVLFAIMMANADARAVLNLHSECRPSMDLSTRQSHLTLLSTPMGKRRKRSQKRHAKGDNNCCTGIY